MSIIMNSIAKPWLEAIFKHSEEWKMVWFGLMFWGSVIFALAGLILTNVNPWVLGSLAYLAGLAIGIIAKIRGRWV